MKSPKTLLLILFILFSFSFSFSASADKDPSDRIKRKLVDGTWTFSNHWNPYKRNEMYWPSTDPGLLNQAYTFYEDGTAIVWSLDERVLPLSPTKKTWGIVYVKNTNGKEVAVIKIVNSSIAPTDQETIQSSSTTGEEFYIISFSTNLLACIPLHSYKTVDKTQNQNVYKRQISLMPKL